MNRTKAIAKYCLECSGDSPKQVTLCHIVDCPLWPYRTGSNIKTKQYKLRMKKAIERYPSEVKEICELSPEIAEFFAP